MISIDVLVTQITGLSRDDLDRWISNDWVRPDGPNGRYVFHDIDVERVRLIQVLRDEMDVNEDALPVVLLLLDQLYDMRRRVRELSDALGQSTPELRDEIARRLVNLPS